MHKARSEFLQVSDLHNIRLQISGNPHGVPLILLHGGPGAGINQNEITAYDPDYYRIITFDQRGAGLSTPAGEVRQNTTLHLIDDINKIRTHLGIDDFILAGGSWGTTLALLYAIRHPEPVKGLILRATYLNRREDMDWMYGATGAALLHPDHWAEFLSVLRKEERNQPVAAYERRLNSHDSAIQTEAASLWNEWPPAKQGNPTRLTFNNAQERDDAVNYSKIGVHYFNRHMFMGYDEILENVDRISHIPMEIVHGAADAIVHPDGAIALAAAHPLATLTIVEGCGHAISEPALQAALAESAHRIKNRKLPLDALNSGHETPKLNF